MYCTNLVVYWSNHGNLLLSTPPPHLPPPPAICLKQGLKILLPICEQMQRSVIELNLCYTWTAIYYTVEVCIYYKENITVHFRYLR
jgi:hypothetical protein